MNILNNLSHPFNRTEENWYLPILKQDTKVEFNNGSIIGKGIVMGIASNPIAVLGYTYIIEPTEINISIDGDYRCIAIAELYLKEL